MIDDFTDMSSQGMDDSGPEPPPKADAGGPTPVAPDAEASPWPDRALTVATAVMEWLSTPRVRLAVIGGILLMLGGLSMTSSVWTLPLVIVGAVMVVIAWIGRRLDGRFAVEWGETGTQLEFRAKIKAPQHARPELAGAPSSSHTLARRAEPAAEHADVIDGEAHTVEIEVAELEALIAAVETTGGEITRTGVSARVARDFRSARGSAGSSEAMH
jgi:hypothetical protein